jgi:tRNA threonylcarbamoyladenosine modification (KEOPS) complex  Pcc1 subunit
MTSENWQLFSERGFFFHPTWVWWQVTVAKIYLLSFRLWIIDMEKSNLRKHKVWNLLIFHSFRGLFWWSVEELWGVVETFGDLRWLEKRLETAWINLKRLFEDFWRLEITSEDFQKLLETSKSFWRLLKISEDFQKLLETSEDLWRFETTSEDFQKLLETSESFWRLLKISGDFWRLLKISEDLWKLLKTWEDLRQLLKIFKKS